MKIAVCGCSFNTPVTGLYAGTHWSELLAKSLNAELLSLARQGISNNAIRLQITEAIKHNPDWIFINATTPNRIEVATDKNNVINPDLGYDVKIGLENFNYDKNKKTRMISETVFSIVDWDRHPFRDYPVDADTRQAVKSYSAFMYDENWKMQLDNWVINSGLWQLHDLGYKFIYNQTIINEHQQYHMLPEWFEKKYLVDKSFDLLILMRENQNKPDPGYHTSPENQIWLAEKYLELLKQRQQLYEEND